MQSDSQGNEASILARCCRERTTLKKALVHVPHYASVAETKKIEFTIDLLTSRGLAGGLVSALGEPWMHVAVAMARRQNVPLGTVAVAP